MRIHPATTGALLGGMAELDINEHIHTLNKAPNYPMLRGLPCSENTVASPEGADLQANPVVKVVEEATVVEAEAAAHAPTEVFKNLFG